MKAFRNSQLIRLLLCERNDLIGRYLIAFANLDNLLFLYLTHSYSLDTSY